MVSIPVLETMGNAFKISPLLNVKDLSKLAGSRKIIERLNLTVSPGKIIGVFGENNSGREMIFDLLTGQLPPSSGHIVFKGEDVTALCSNARQERGISCAMHPDQLFGELSALENVLLLGGQSCRPFYPRAGGKSYTDDAMDLLKFVGLEHKADEQADRLSPFEQCLLTNAIALSCKPSLLLLDAPDMQTAVTRNAVFSLLKRIVKTGVTVMFTSQDRRQAIEICDKIVVFGEGGNTAKYRSSAMRADIAVTGGHEQYLQ